MSVDTSDLLKAHQNRKKTVVRVKLEDKEMADLKNTIAKQRSVGREQQDGHGKRDTTERESTFSGQTYGLASRQRHFAD